MYWCMCCGSGERENRGTYDNESHSKESPTGRHKSDTQVCTHRTDSMDLFVLEDASFYEAIVLLSNELLRDTIW